MIHINSNKSSSLFHIRPRMHISFIIIVFLVISLLYTISLNSTNQINVESLNMKIVNYQRMLQGKQVEKQKYLSMLQSTENEKSKIKNELQSKIAKLYESLREMEKENSNSREESANLQERLKAVQDKLNEQIEKDSNISSNNMKAMNEKIEKIEQLDARNKLLEKTNAQLKFNVDYYKNLTRELRSIKLVLSQSGLQVLIPNHPRFNEMSSQDRFHLFSLFVKDLNEARAYEYQWLKQNQSSTFKSNIQPDVNEQLHSNTNQSKLSKDQKKEEAINELSDNAKGFKSNVAVSHTINSSTHADLNLSHIYSNISYKFGVKNTANNNLEFTDKSQNSREGNTDEVRLTSVVKDASHKNQSNTNTEVTPIHSENQVDNTEKQKFEEKSTNISVQTVNDINAKEIFNKSTFEVKHALPKSENDVLASVSRVENVQKENRSLISTSKTDDQNHLNLENKPDADHEAPLNETTNSKDHYRINAGSRKESLFQETKFHSLKQQNQNSLNDANNEEKDFPDRNEIERNDSNFKAKQNKNFRKNVNNEIIDDYTDPKDDENADLEFENFENAEEDDELNSSRKLKNVDKLATFKQLNEVHQLQRRIADQTAEEVAKLAALKNMKDSAPRAKLVMDDDDDEKPNLFDDNQVKVSEEVEEDDRNIKRPVLL